MATSPPRPIRVFLCHATEDKTRVRRLYRRLRDDGFAPWLDEEDLLGGQDWDAEICKAVRDTDIVVVCMSATSVTKTGYVQKEIRVALDAADEQPDGTIFIIPVKLEACNIPDRLRDKHEIPLFNRGGYARLKRTLASHHVTQRLWHETADDESAPGRDPKTLKHLVSSLESILTPHLNEAVNHLEESIDRYKDHKTFDALLEFCMSSRVAWAQLFDHALTVGSPPAELTQKLDQTLSAGAAELATLPNGDESQRRLAAEYRKSIKVRQRMVNAFVKDGINGVQRELQRNMPRKH